MLERLCLSFKLKQKYSRRNRNGHYDLIIFRHLKTPQLPSNINTLSLLAAMFEISVWQGLTQACSPLFCAGWSPSVWLSRHAWPPRPSVWTGPASSLASCSCWTTLYGLVDDELGLEWFLHNTSNIKLSRLNHPPVSPWVGAHLVLFLRQE